MTASHIETFRLWSGANKAHHLRAMHDSDHFGEPDTPTNMVAWDGEHQAHHHATESHERHQPATAEGGYPLEPSAAQEATWRDAQAAKPRMEPGDLFQPVYAHLASLRNQMAELRREREHAELRGNGWEERCHKAEKQLDDTIKGRQQALRDLVTAEGKIDRLTQERDALQGNNDRQFQQIQDLERQLAEKPETIIISAKSAAKLKRKAKEQQSKERNAL